MIKNTIDKLLRHRHFWRDLDFSELSEVYISMLFRSLSISVVSIFIPFYMLSIGYSAVDFMVVMAWYFGARFLFFDVFAGWVTSMVGPKHTIIASYILLALSTLQFLTLASVHWPLWLLGAIWGGSTSLFAIPFHVDFSRIQHKEHGGKELAYINILQKVGAIFGPIISGIIGLLFGGQYIFVAAMILLFIGGLPLLKTAEPIPLGRPLNILGLNFLKIKRDLVSFMAASVDHTVSIALWPLYLGVFILTGSAAYAKLGFLASFSVIVSLGTAYTIGRIIDAHHGRSLLRAGATTNAFVHLLRPFISNYPTAVVVNAANDGITTSYSLPYVKGMYDAGDEKGEHRVAYFTSMEWMGSLARCATWVLLIILTQFIADRSVINIGFLLAAVASLLIMVEAFPALSSRKNKSV